MQYNRLNDPNALLKLIKALEQRVASVETRGTGPIGFVGSDGVELHIGVQPDGQAAIIPFVGDVTPPPIATSPDASAGPGFITVTWDGLFVNGETMPLDFEHLNVVGSRIVNGVSDLTVEVGIIRNPMDSCLVGTDVAAVGETWEFVFVSEDYNGNLSSISAKSEQVVQKSFAADVLIDEALEGLQQDFISAQNAAASAQQAADAAQDAADEAALILTSKGAIYSQSETPDADPNGLWIDTGHSNVPRRYLGTGKALAVHVGGGASAGTRLTALGWTVTTVTAMPTLEEASEYDLVAFDAGYAGLSSAYGSLASSLLDKGVSVFSSGNDTTNLPPLFTGGLTRGTPKNTIRPVGTHEAAIGWAEYSDGDLNYYLTGVKSDAVVTGVTLVTSLGTDQPLNIVWEHPTTFARWAHVETYASPVSVLNAHMGWIADNWIAIQDQSVVASIAAAQLKADQAFNNAATAATAAGTAQTTADSKNRSWYQDDQPAGTSHKVGDSWYDTNDGYKLRTWTGSIWQTTQDSALAQQIAESKGRTYTQAVAPPVEARNDKNLWIDTSLGEGLYVTKYWNGTIWTALTSKDASDAQDLAESKGETIYSSTEPAAAKRLPQNTWVDTSGGLNIQKRWDGNAWVVVVDSRIPSTASAVTALDVRVDGVSAATSFEISEIETRVDTVSAVAESKGEIIYSSTTPPASKALPQNQWVDTTGGLNIVKRWNTATGTWVIASDQRIDANAAAVTAVDTRVTSVSAAASGQIVSVDSRVTGVSAAAASGISTVDARVTSVSATASSEATAKADAAAASAISSQAYSNNASFDNWTSTFPVGYANWSATPIKETSIVKRAPYSMRFNVADATAQHGVSWSSIMAHAPNLEFFTVEVDLYLVSGTLDGSGMILDWAGMTNNRAQIQFATELPGAVTGKWYRVSKVLRRPTNATGTWTAMTGYLMGQWSGHGTGAAKNIIFDWFNVRPSTVEEILSYKAPTTQDLTAVDTRVTGVSAAASTGITTVDTRVTGVSAAANTQINNVDTRVTGVSAAADAELTVIDTRVTGVSSTASTQIGTVDSRVTGVSAAASTQIGTVDSRVTGVSSTASTQIGAVDSRVTGVSAAAGSAISTVDSRVTGVSSATNLALASVQADIDQVWASSRSYVNDATSAQDIQVMNGIAPTVATSASAMGGKALQKAGTSHGWWHDNRAKQAYDPTALYRLSIRVRVVTPQSNGGGKGLYWGFAGLAADGTTFVNATGANSYSSQQWAYNNTQVPTDGSWVDYVAYYRGLSATTPSGSGTSVQTARLMHADTRYVVPSMLIDYNAGNGVWEISHWSIDVIDAAGYASLIEASNKSVSYYQDAKPTGGTYKKGDIWFDTDDGNKIYVHNGTDFTLSQDADIAKSISLGHSTDWDTNQPNKWAYTKFLKTTTSGTSPTFNDIAGLTGVTTLITDTTNLVQTQGDNYIGQLRTIVYVAATKTVSWTMSHDDGARVYVDGSSIYSATGVGSNASVSVSLAAGWHVIDILWAEQAGGDGVWAFTPLLSTQVTNMYAPVSPTDLAATANTALTSANGKNKIIWSPSAATGTTGYSAGDIWFQTASGIVTGQWEFTNAWQVRTIDNAVIANLNAGKITAGTLAADRIGANTIAANKLVLGDLTNLASDGNFQDVNKLNWVGSGVVTVSAGEANRLMITTAASGNNDQSNRNVFQVSEGDQFYGEMWVYGAPTNVGGGGPNLHLTVSKLDGTTIWPAFGYLTRDAVSGQWVKLSGSVTIPAGAKTAKVEPAISFSADAVGNVYYIRDVVVRRKNSANLIVDGAIQANSAIIANGAIGNAQIADLNADKITAGTIAAGRLNAEDIRTKLIEATTINAVDIISSGSISSSTGVFGVLDASSINAGTLAADRLDANTIRAKLLSAAKINAVDIIASGSISSSSGVFGDINASAITSGTLSAARIGAGSITASALSVTMGGNNLVTNSSFEADSNSDGLADGWSVWTRGTGDAGRVFTNTRVAGLFPGSTWAQRVTSTTVTNTEQSSIQATTLFAIKAGDTATLSLYGRASVAGNFSISMRCEDDAAVYKGDANFTAAFTTTTQRFAGIVVIPAGTTRAKVTITTPNSLSNGHWFEVDGVKVELGDVVSAWSPMTAELLPGTINATMLTADAINGKVITGSTVQTEATASRGIKLTTAELAGYDGSGVKNFSLTSTGTLTLRGSLLSGSSIQGASVSASGIYTNASPTAGVKLSDTGIKAYNGSGALSFHLDATTGLLEVPGLKANAITSTMISATAIDGKTITGATVQTETTANRGIKLTSAELAGYDGSGVKNFSLTSGGSLALRGDLLSGSTITGATLAASGGGIVTTTAANRGVKLQDTGITTYDSVGNITFKVDAATGLVEAPGLKAGSISSTMISATAIDGKTITGATVQTEATANRGIKLTSAELAGYDAAGVKNLSLTSAGALYLRGEIKSGSTIEGARLTGTQGIETSTVANTGVKINNVGIKAYDAGNNLTFHLDATTGMLEVPGLKANSITGDKIAADTISTRNLLLTDLTNHIENPLFEAGSLAGWTVTGGWFVNNSSAQEGTYKALTQYSGAEQTLINNAQVYLNALDKVKVKLYVWTDAPTSGTRLTIGLSNVSGGASEDVQTPAITNGAWTEITVTLTATTAGYKKLRLATTGVGTGFVRVDNIRMFKMGMGNMIVDGAITTDHMTSGTIDGGVISAGTLTSTEIKAKSLTVDDLVVTSTDNLVVEADFGNGGTSWDLGAAYKFIMAGRGQGGTDALRIVGSTAEVKSRNLANKIAVDPENRYRAEISVRSTEAMLTGTVKMYLRCYTTPIVYTDVLVMSNEAPLVVDTWTKITAMLPELPPGTLAVEVIIAAHNQSDTTWTEFDYVSMTRAMDASLVVDGSITAAKIDAEAVNATHLAANSVTASAIDAQAVTADKLESELVLATKIVAGDPLGTRAEMAPNGFRVLAPEDPSDPLSPVSEVVRMGTSDTNDYFAIVKADGTLAASLSEDGTMSSQRASINGEIEWRGESFTSMYDALPKGIVAWGSRSDSSPYWADTNYQPYLSLTFDAIAGRAYRVWTGPISMDGDTATALPMVSLHYNLGTTVTTASTRIAQMVYDLNPSTAGRRNTLSMNRLLTPATTSPHSLLLSYGVGATGTGRGKIIATNQATAVIMAVEDIGLAPAETGESPNGTGDSATSNPTPPPAKVNYVKTYYPIDNRSYTGTGAHYNYNTGYRYTGLSPAGYGDLRSMAMFSGQIATDVGSGTITKVRVYGYYHHWYYNSGGTADITVYGGTSLPATLPTVSGYQHVSTAWPKPGGRWVTLDSSTYAGIKAGTSRGIIFGGRNRGYLGYGYLNDIRIEVSYTK